MELGDISDGMQIGASVLQFIGSLRKVVGADVISAFFKYDGTRIEGSEKIEVQLLPDKNSQQIWWYTVKAIEDYVFLRIPVIQSCAHEITGRLNNELQNDARYWRWVPPVLPGRIYGGDEQPLNLKVDFLVFGYRPKALLSHFGK